MFYFLFSAESVEEDMTSQRYSMEYAFNMRSISHLFLDMIRDFYEKNRNKEQKGFMSGSGGRETFIKCLQCLCSDLENLFATE